MRHADADHGGQPLANVLAGRNQVLVEAGLLAVGVEGPGQGGTEPGDVRPPLGRADVVDVAVQAFGVFRRVLHGDVPGDAGGFSPHADHVGVHGIAGLVEVLDELLDAALEVVPLVVATGGVVKLDPQPGIEERQLPQPPREDVPGELGLREDLRVGLEGRLRARAGGGSHLPHRTGGLAPLVFLLPDVSLAGHLHLAPLG